MRLIEDGSHDGELCPKQTERDGHFVPHPGIVRTQKPCDHNAPGSGLRVTSRQIWVASPTPPWPTGQDVAVILAAMLYALVASVALFAVLTRRGPLSRPTRVGCVGLWISFVGVMLTPGVAWGDFNDGSARELISVLAFYVGVGVMIWAAVLWRRERSQIR